MTSVTPTSSISARNNYQLRTESQTETASIEGIALRQPSAIAPITGGEPGAASLSNIMGKVLDVLDMMQGGTVQAAPAGAAVVADEDASDLFHLVDGGLPGAGSLSAESTGGEAGDRLRDLLSSLDVNAEGTVNRDEFAAATQTLPPVDDGVAEVRRLLGGKDGAGA